mgnify:CR=1 FL=1
MNEVYSNIFIGNWIEGQTAAKSGEYFTINVTEIVENPFAQLQYKLVRQYAATDALIIPISDLEYLADIIDAHWQFGERCVVHCTAGIERSPLVVAYYLHKYHNLSLDEAYAIIRGARPEILDRRGWIQYESPKQFLEESKQ